MSEPTAPNAPHHWRFPCPAPECSLTIVASSAVGWAAGAEEMAWHLHARHALPLEQADAVTWASDWARHDLAPLTEPDEDEDPALDAQGSEPDAPGTEAPDNSRGEGLPPQRAPRPRGHQAKAPCSRCGRLLRVNTLPAHLARHLREEREWAARRERSARAEHGSADAEERRRERFRIQQRRRRERRALVVAGT